MDIIRKICFFLLIIWTILRIYCNFALLLKNVQVSKNMNIKKIWFCTFILWIPLFASAYNLKQLSNRDGLSNSAILSICQDNERFLWFGSCDGLNMYDGTKIQLYKPTYNNPNALSGNLIEGIMESENGILWIATNHGLNRLNKKNNTIEYHNEFQGKYHWAKTTENEVFAIHENNRMDYYHKEKKSFISCEMKGINNADTKHFFIDNRNLMWIITNDGIVNNFEITFQDSIPQFKRLESPIHNEGILYAFQEKEFAYLIDINYNFFELNTHTEKKTLIMNLRSLILENGIVSSIIRDDDDYMIGFQTNGLFCLKNTPENEVKYHAERIEIYCGVFSLCKDDVQGIIWIGTDGQGVYMFSRNSFSIRSTTFENLPYRIEKPVRALLLDKEKNLWMGTKDDGILMIKNFRNSGDIGINEVNYFTSSNSLLLNNNVYAFANSRRNILWIGGDGPGLNYYSYKEKRIKMIPSLSPDQINYVHSICEINDTVLWLATVGSGILKVTLTGTPDAPVIKSVKRTLIIRNEPSYNYFFSAYQENDSILWFGNRGHGVQKLNILTETFEPIKFQKEGIETINDILSIHKDSNNDMWFGSSYGITKLKNMGKESEKNMIFQNFNEMEELPNNTIHGILEDGKGYLWLSTNSGIIRFDPIANSFNSYNHSDGLEVIEFSDGAYYKDESSGMLFFGGTNGFISISPDIFVEKSFVPPIYFTELKIYENNYNLSEFMIRKENEEYLQLHHEQNFFSISFVALDYINGQNCRYSYKLEKFNDKWINIGKSGTVNFTNISPGEYILHVKCANSMNDFTNDAYSLKIIILPPWYMTYWAYLAYLLLSIAMFIIIVQIVRRGYRKKREHIIEKMNQQQKEEIYESKLRFFTNITHELSTPLTLIYGPCERLASYTGADAYVRKYTGSIMKNAERLNSLIQELIEFRRIETGNKPCKIKTFNITEFTQSIADSFVDMAESKGVDYQISIEENLVWNSDKECLTKIISNLLSNAFKYTPDNGKICLSVKMAGSLLEIVVSNTGKGIKGKDIPYIFDRYRVLEDFEKQTQKGLSARNGLGLAICHNMVKLLNGEIEVKSIPEEWTEFRTTLPSLEVNFYEKTEQYEEATLMMKKPETDKPVIEPKDQEYAFNHSRPTILVIEDDPEMLWFVSEIFIDKYNVIPVEDSSTVETVLEKIQPNLIISDIMMAQLDGLSLLKQIKSNRHTTHIPYILLSAKSMTEEQTEGILAGAEAYITKPFNVDYLKSVVNRLLQRQDDLKDYYHSALSAFDLSDGKYVHVEDKDFYDKVIQTIDENISNPDFSAEELASILCISSRQLYRKLKKSTEHTPTDIIRNYRLTIVERLLTTTQLSVDEIMYKAGFINRGNMNRWFTQKYGATPKNYRISKKEEIK